MAKKMTPTGGLLSYFTRHATAANLVLVLVIGAGLYALPNMRSQFFPDSVVDTVRVSVQWDGAGAEDVDNGIIQVLEPLLLAVEGVLESSASSSEGRGSISLDFEPGYDIQLAAEDVQAVLDSTSSLPDGADDPEISSGGWRDSVTDVVITGPVGLDQLANFADEFVIRLFSEGVTNTSISGVAAAQTLVQVKTINLIKHDISMSEIATAIEGETDTSPAGSVAGGASRVRTGVEKRSAVDIAGIILRSNDDGSKLTVGDVADISVEGIDRNAAFYVADNSAVTIQVTRSSAGDALGLQASTEEVMAEMMLTLPEGVTMDLFRPRSEAIQARLDILLSNGAMGLLLVMGLLFLFLNARTAIWVAAGIPVAMLSAIALMYAVGITINVISLFALIITLGIVVDDAIVVGEHADFRARRLGEGPIEAAENAARRMFAPVFSSTMTTIIAFFALTTISGRLGDTIGSIPFTVIVVLIASLIECFLILPNHLSHSIASTTKEHWYDWPSRKVNIGFRWVRNRFFTPFIRVVVQARYLVAAGALFILVSQVTMVMTGAVQWRIFTGPEQSVISGNFAMAPSATREDSFEMLAELQRAAEQAGKDIEAEHGVNPIAYAVSQIGGNTGRGLSGTDSKESYQLGGISIELISADERPFSSSVFVAQLQSEIINHPLAETVSFRSRRFGPGGDSIDIKLIGSDSATQKAAAEELKDELAQYGEVSALEDNLSYDKEELILELTAQGEALGFSIDTLGATLTNRLGGIEAASFPDGTRTATIQVELPDDELTADFLDRTLLRSSSGEYLALSDIVSATSQTGFSTIRRENGVRVVTVSGDLSEDDAARATEITNEISAVILPALEEKYGITTDLGGLAEQETNFLSDALFGLLAALVGIYLTLAWIFSSWTRPIVVMSIIPFGLIGAIWGHYIWDVTLSMFSVVGLIGMTGIIINDSIVLVTTIDEYAEDRGLIPAIVDATTDRLRPVMLTTLTTVLGLAPLLYEQSADAQFLKPTVITLVYGLGFGMIIVLLLIPAFTAMQLDAGRQFTALKRLFAHPKKFGRQGQAALAAAAALVIWFAVTIGAFVMQGTILPAFSIFGLAEAGFMQVAMIFLAGAAICLISIYAMAQFAGQKKARL